MVGIIFFLSQVRGVSFKRENADVYPPSELTRCYGCPPWATRLSYPWDMRYRAGVRPRLISLRFTLRAAFGRLPSQRPLACVPVSGLRFPVFLPPS